MTQVFYQNTVVAAHIVNAVMIDDVYHFTSISEHASGSPIWRTKWNGRKYVI